jgi:hypothetical protein
MKIWFSNYHSANIISLFAFRICQTCFTCPGRPAELCAPACPPRSNFLTFVPAQVPVRFPAWVPIGQLLQKNLATIPMTDLMTPRMIQLGFESARTCRLKNLRPPSPLNRRRVSLFRKSGRTRMNAGDTKLSFSIINYSLTMSLCLRNK